MIRIGFPEMHYFPMPENHHFLENALFQLDFYTEWHNILHRINISGKLNQISTVEATRRNLPRKMNLMDKIKTKFISEITVIDPDSKLPVEVSIFKLENGGIVGIDSSFLSNTDEPVYSPYNRNVEVFID